MENLMKDTKNMLIVCGILLVLDAILLAMEIVFNTKFIPIGILKAEGFCLIGIVVGVFMVRYHVLQKKKK